MSISKISTGENPPEILNAVIEIPANSSVKYEYDKENDVLSVDRFMMGPVYPYAYGFIPNTLSGDGDPCDVLVIVDLPLIPGCVVKVRPIGVLMTEDEKGTDEKVLAVPVDHPYYTKVVSYEDLPSIVIDKITHFFASYKALEKGKWVRVNGVEGNIKAFNIIKEGIERFKKLK